MTIVENRAETLRPAPPSPGRAVPPPPSRTPAKSPWPKVIAIAVVLGVAVGGTSLYLNRQAAADGSVLTAVVQVDSFDVRIPLNGEMKASRNVEIRNQVEGQTTIVSIVPEGKQVNEGDVLVSLASDAIKDRLEESRIRLDNAMAATINAQEGVKIQEMENDSLLKTSEITAELARLEYDQYVKGDSTVQIEALKTALENAKTDLERKTKDLARVRELAQRQFVSENDVLDSVIAERNSRNALETAEMNISVWRQYSEPRQRQTLKRKLDAALAEVERTKARAAAQLGWRQADLRAKQSTQRVEEQRYKAFQEQLEACTIKAPQAGMVVYQTSFGGNQNQGPIEEGATVRQNQVLIQLPDTSRMMVEVRLPEQLTDKVRRGQDAVITVDAVPGKVFRGKVENIAVLPDSSQRWANPNLKEYLTTIVLNEMDPAFKPGMSAKTDIMVERLTDVLAVPLQAVFTNGGETYVFVGDAAKYEKRVVHLGMSSSTQAEVKTGLKSGEQVLLSRPKGAAADEENARKKDGKNASDGKDAKPENGAATPARGGGSAGGGA